MNLLPELAKAIQEENLRAAARRHLDGRASAARRERRRGAQATRLAVLRTMRILRVHHVVQAL